MATLSNSADERPGSSSSTQSPSHASSDCRVYRRILRQCVAAICHSAGFQTAQADALDALTFLTHKFMSNACQSSRALCEHTGRSMISPGDVYLALLNEGRPEITNFGDFLRSLHRRKQHTFTLRSLSPPQVPPLLRISDPRPHPTHFPNFLPPFPDPHTYIRTEVRDEVDTNYERVRRLNAQNKRDWESSLVNYALSQYPTVSVFRELEAHHIFEAKDEIQKQRENRCQRRQQQMVKQQQTAAKSAIIGLGKMALMMNGEEEGEEEEEKAAASPMTGRRGGGGGTEEAEDEETEEMLPPTVEEDDDELPDKVAGGGGEETEAPEKCDAASNIFASTVTSDGEVTNNGADAIGRAAAKVGGVKGETSDDPLFEELFDPIDTERSFVLKLIPHYCHILLPFEETRPYLSALLTDDVCTSDHGAAEDEQHYDYFARILSKEMMEEEGTDEAPMAGKGGGGDRASSRSGAEAAALRGGQPMEVDSGQGLTSLFAF